MQLFLLSLGSLLSASEAAEHPQPKCLIDVDVALQCANPG